MQTPVISHLGHLEWEPPHLGDLLTMQSGMILQVLLPSRTQPDTLVP